MIPVAIRKKLSNDPRMKKCIACGSQKEIEWNHALIYAGKQIQEEYAIQPLCRTCHRGNNGTIDTYADNMSKLIAITMGIKDLQRKYPKHDWLQQKNYLQINILYEKQ